MKRSIFLTILTFSLQLSLFAQDTLAGWTFPTGTKNQLANLGNELNKGGMYFEAAKIDEIPFTSLLFTDDGYMGKSISAAGWDSGTNLKCWKISVDATGYTRMFMYARMSSDKNHPGPRDFKLQYRLGCCSPVWHDIPDVDPIRVDTGFFTTFLDSILIPNDATEMPGLQIRWVMTSDTSTTGNIVAKTGKSLMDEVLVLGYKVDGIRDHAFKTFNLQVIQNTASSTIFLKSDVKIEQAGLYDLNGKLISSGQISSTENQLSYPQAIRGIFIIKATTHNGLIQTKKLFLY
jgi:hypothetical protein